MAGFTREFFRSCVYPGLDLHLRFRKGLSRFWKTGNRDVLDAGCGNGYLSWVAQQSGARVVAMSFDPAQISKAQSLLNGYYGIPSKELSFEHYNLYDLPAEKRQFDEIICFEVLEHLSRDRDVVSEFYRLLRPGGYLHVCCPYALHPRHQAEVLDTQETGGHVRAGYTEESYRDLLEPIGFQIDRIAGVGPKSLYTVDQIVRTTRNRFGDLVALPLLPLALPFVWLASKDCKTPFSIYARAVKPKS
jgi:SAM-dependent methyltransferase